MAEFRSCIEARAYVLNMLATIIDHEFTDPEGWMFGGVDDEFSQRRLKKELAKMRLFLLKRRARLLGSAPPAPKSEGGR